MEDKQLKILFGVCILFVVCHTCRIFRHFEELYQKSTNMDIFRPCNEGCASPYSLSSHVSITYKGNLHRFNVKYLSNYVMMVQLYNINSLVISDDGKHKHIAFSNLTFFQPHYLLLIIENLSKKCLFWNIPFKSRTNK